MKVKTANKNLRPDNRDGTEKQFLFEEEAAPGCGGGAERRGACVPQAVPTVREAQSKPVT
jgi:hypothetical protein